MTHRPYIVEDVTDPDRRVPVRRFARVQEAMAFIERPRGPRVVLRVYREGVPPPIMRRPGPWRREHERR